MRRTRGMRERNRGPKLGLSFDGGRFDERGVAVDAGLNARRSGEAFGLSIAEFLSDSLEGGSVCYPCSRSGRAARPARFPSP
jgi:hypothetical protein